MDWKQSREGGEEIQKYIYREVDRKEKTKDRKKKEAEKYEERKIKKTKTENNCQVRKPMKGYQRKRNEIKNKNEIKKKSERDG